VSPRLEGLHGSFCTKNHDIHVRRKCTAENRNFAKIPKLESSKFLCRRKKLIYVHIPLGDPDIIHNNNRHNWHTCISSIVIKVASIFIQTRKNRYIEGFVLTLKADNSAFMIMELGSRRVWSVDRGCLLFLCTWSHLRGSVLANLFLWLVIPTYVSKLITLWYLSHFIIASPLRRKEGVYSFTLVCLWHCDCVCVRNKLSSQFPQQLLIADTWNFSTLFPLAYHVVGFIFVRIWCQLLVYPCICP
jgi:hypothetical protein